MQLTTHEKVIVGCSSVATALALIMVAERMTSGSFPALLALVAVLSGLTVLSTLRGARLRRSGPPAP
jgi:hypothetical protein